MRRRDLMLIILLVGSCLSHAMESSVSSSGNLENDGDREECKIPYDKIDRCEAYSTNGYCVDKDRMDYMGEHCKVSCEMCGPESASIDSDLRCPVLAKNGYCVGSDIQRKCAHSCKKYQNTKHAPEPAPSPAPEPAPSPAPEPAPSPAPEPSPSPAPEPAPSPAPEPAPSQDFYSNKDASPDHKPHKSRGKHEGKNHRNHHKKHHGKKNNKHHHRN